MTFEEVQFAWLEPIASGTPTGSFESGLTPVVTIRDLDATDPPVVLEASEQDGFYLANWTTTRSWENHTFEIVAELDGVAVGRLEVELIRGSSTNAGRTFPVKFWIGEVAAQIADCVGDDRCNAVPVPGSSTEDVVIETYDENDNLMAALIIPAGAAPVPLNVTVDCREDGYAAGEGPLPTGLDQWPLFCRVDARELDGTPFTGQLNMEARIEICVVDELFQDMVPYHGFADHTQLVLGKSPSGSGDTDFEFLPYVETEIIGGCEYIRLSSSPQVGFLDRLKAPFDGLFRLMGPQPLNATMFRRDGGVGGTLTAFSDINPVSPAYIEGSVFGGVGEEVTLTGGSLSLQTTVDANGGYSFGPLPVPVGGATYTVQVGNESQNVNLAGSGTEQVDFILQGSLELSGFGSIYDDVGLAGPNGVTNLTDAKAPFYTNTYSGCTITQASNPLFADATLTTMGLATPTTGWGRGTANPRLEYLATLTLDVFVPLGTDRLEIIGYVDNDAKVEINGEDITDTVVPASGAANYTRGDTKYDAASGWFLHGGCADLPGTLPLFTAGSGTFTPGQTNTLTFMVRDYGTVGYADFQVTAVAGA